MLRSPTRRVGEFELRRDLPYKKGLLAFLRLFRYDRVKKTNEVLLDELSFANGLALSPSEDFIILAETTAMRLRRYYLKGSRAGESEVFVEGLPGWPDNLTADEEGIWVPLSVASDSQNPNLFAVLAPYPRLRSFFGSFGGSNATSPSSSEPYISK